MRFYFLILIVIFLNENTATFIKFKKESRVSFYILYSSKSCKLCDIELNKILNNNFKKNQLFGIICNYGFMYNQECYSFNKNYKRKKEIKCIPFENIKTIFNNRINLELDSSQIHFPSLIVVSATDTTYLSYDELFVDTNIKKSIFSNLK